MGISRSISTKSGQSKTAMTSPLSLSRSLVQGTPWDAGPIGTTPHKVHTSMDGASNQRRPSFHRYCMTSCQRKAGALLQGQGRCADASVLKIVRVHELLAKEPA